jgi:NADH dehydrogenase
MIAVLVLGGSGFVGRHLVARLVAAGCRVTVPSRRPARARSLTVLPAVRVVDADVHQDSALAPLIAEHDAIVNLIGILHGRPGRYPPAEAGSRAGQWPLDVAALDIGPDFGRAHVDLADRVVRLAPPGMRLIHMSALGAQAAPPAELPSRYLRSKAAAEAIVSASNLAWTIVRPSLLFGEGDSSLSLFAALQGPLPVLALPRAKARFQPLWVGDLARAMAACLVDPRGRLTVGRAFEVAGPTVMTLADMVRLAGQAAGHRRPVIGLPDGLGRLLAALMEIAPGPTLMSRDNLASMSIDNVLPANATPLLPVFDIVPRPVDEVLPSYLGRLHTDFDEARLRAGH